jgi:hypothetical protein
MAEGTPTPNMKTVPHDYEVNEDKSSNKAPKLMEMLLPFPGGKIESTVILLV